MGALALSQRWLLGCAIALTVACAVIAVLKPWPLKVLADVGLGQDQQADSIFSILPQATVSPMFLVIANTAIKSGSANASFGQRIERPENPSKRAPNRYHSGIAGRMLQAFGAVVC